MPLQIIIFVSAFAVCYTNAALLLWSNHKFEISPLKSFTDENLAELVEELGYPEVALFKTSSLASLPGLKEVLDGYYTAYSPNDDLNTENATEISGHEDLASEIKQRMEFSQGNVLSVMVISSGRRKREVSTTEPSTSIPDKVTKEPVVYRAQSIKNKTYGLLYSSQQLLLKTNSTNLLLGATSPDMVTMDTINRDAYTRLNVRIPIEEGNFVILRFIFEWSSSSYWSLTMVKLSESNNFYNLSTEQKISAPAHFSYHCNGDTVFTDGGNIELYVYDLQVQIDSNDGNFSDAYDCVSFTTGPIWSGLFVTAILGIGMIIALVAISDIKTMDKFDNQKTKQLSITVSE